MRLRNEKVLTAAMWLLMVGISLWGWLYLPDRPIATHFSAATGLANGFMPRDIALAFGPGMALLLILLLVWILPGIMPKSAPIDRSIGVYGIVTVCVVAIVVLTHILLVLSAGGLALDRIRILFAAIGMLFVILGNYMPKMRQNWLMGIRTPWTLSNEEVWDRTHRFAGPLFMLGGIAIAACALFGPMAWRLAVLLAGVLIPSILAYIYSFVAARRLGAA